MRHNQKGFGGLEVLLIILLIAVIAGTGWYVWNNKDASQSSDTTSEAITDGTTSENANANTKKYKNEALGFDFIYPAEWGNVQVDTEENNPGTVSFSGLGEKLRLKQHTKPIGTKVSVSFQVQSECEYIAEDSWKPVAGAYPPTDCPDTTREESATKVYVFEYGAIGAYAYKEVAMSGSSMYEFVEYADFEKDFTEAIAGPEIKDGVVERIAGHTKAAVKDFLTVQ